MQQGCRFCTQNLNSVQDITRHYNDVHGIKKDNSPQPPTPTSESYIDVISKDPREFFVENCEYWTGPPFLISILNRNIIHASPLKLLSAERICWSGKSVINILSLALTTLPTVSFMILRILKKFWATLLKMLPVLYLTQTVSYVLSLVLSISLLLNYTEEKCTQIHAWQMELLKVLWTTGSKSFY